MSRASIRRGRVLRARAVAERAAQAAAADAAATAEALTRLDERLASERHILSPDAGMTTGAALAARGALGERLLAARIALQGRRADAEAGEAAAQAQLRFARQQRRTAEALRDQALTAEAAAEEARLIGLWRWRGRA